MAAPLFLVGLAARKKRRGGSTEKPQCLAFVFLGVQTGLQEHLPPSRLISCRQVVKMGREEEERKGEIAKMWVVSGSLLHKRLSSCFQTEMVVLFFLIPLDSWRIPGLARAV